MAHSEKMLVRAEELGITRMKADFLSRWRLKKAVATRESGIVVGAMVYYGSEGPFMVKAIQDDRSSITLEGRPGAFNAINLTVAR